LNEKLQTEGKREGGVISFEAENEGGKKFSAKILKPYVKRFLYNNGIRKDFRVLSEEGELKVVKLEAEKEDEGKSKT
jgi:hypothetical protein